MVATVMHTKYTSSMITKGKKQKIKNLYQTNQHPALYKIKERNFPLDHTKKVPRNTFFITKMDCSTISKVLLLFFFQII